MTIVLFLFILLAAACIVYSILRYKQSDQYRFTRAERTNDIYMYEKNGKIFMTTKGVTFQGYIQIEPNETVYSVAQINIVFDGPKSRLLDITRNDLYDIEKQLYTKYPNTQVDWQPPMSDLLNSI
ncbi:hypothetical protein EV207_10189 [Scopulibacillus darangshiensis]|uniref:Sigma-w pathway protein ysdB n=1 Tax=Scopulibacillus darangshiensis TaxID=442528 RepID=A0A4R2PCM0_9BACL|nr:hypothetical protein [Scopulibacillus darangshiensis]TCP32114.1 hypothetical protein EV207_10189 [Scopulibacillus darangshiensis]